ncbi:MAG: succinyldiaminopimelate aminotransferase [Gammaproteobacteria bacterium RIFCSPHIGHO2_12_FULL_35_23]|nr:MAG: succinyldiaminopimelate aminotransferase [Gammaproteobacteria bacterium RIFCSPHIGHO2_12_FULL_35_23]
MSYHAIFDRLWKQYSSEISEAREIYKLFTEQGEKVINDHIALRTFNDPRVNTEFLAKPFIAVGYVEKGHYDFPVKQLKAKHYEHADKEAPKVFISELLVEKFSPALQQAVKAMIDKVPHSILQNPNQLLFCKTPWQPLSYKLYEKLLAESQYAAWMYAYGYRANHFTISVNSLKKFPTLQAVNDFVKKHGFILNTSEGEIKGTPAELLEQSSTMAGKQKVKFEEGEFEIPSCYYEFAKRYPGKDGKLYQGFIAASADKIFESTDTKK